MTLGHDYIKSDQFLVKARSGGSVYFSMRRLTRVVMICRQRTMISIRGAAHGLVSFQ